MAGLTRRFVEFDGYEYGLEEGIIIRVTPASSKDLINVNMLKAKIRRELESTDLGEDAETVESVINTRLINECIKTCISINGVGEIDDDLIDSLPAQLYADIVKAIGSSEKFPLVNSRAGMETKRGQ